MTCADAEILICDYLDGTLDGAAKAVLEHHFASCRACAELARDAGAAVEFMERAAEVEPPPELLTRILFDPPWGRHRKPKSRLLTWVTGLVQPILQPRLAMGMAMTILSLAMLAKFVPLNKQLRAEDLNPVKVWRSLDDRVYRGWERTVKFYENIRFVYQIRNRLREWQQQQDEESATAPEQPAATDTRRLPVKPKETKGKL